MTACGTRSGFCGTGSRSCGRYSRSCGTHWSFCGAHSSSCGRGCVRGVRARVPEVGVSVLGLGSLIVGRAVELFRLTVELLRLTVESLRFTVELLRFEVAYLRCAGEFARYGIEFTRRAITSAGTTFRPCGRLRLLADGVEFWRSTLAGDGNALQFLRKAPTSCRNALRFERHVLTFGRRPRDGIGCRVTLCGATTRSTDAEVSMSDLLPRSSRSSFRYQGTREECSRQRRAIDGAHLASARKTMRLLMTIRTLLPTAF